MSVFTSVGILLFSMLIMVFLQFVPGIFALFHHTMLGKSTKKRADFMSLFFILGVEFALAFLLILIYIIINSSFVFLTLFESKISAFVASGVLTALGFLFAFCYFRRGTGTKLFIPASLKHKYLAKIESLSPKKAIRSNSFLLGFVSVLPELVFTFPLLILAAYIITTLGPDPLTRASLLLLFVVISILPLIALYFFFSQQNTLADFLRARFKNKFFIRFIIPLSYFFLSTLIFIGATL